MDDSIRRAALHALLDREQAAWDRADTLGRAYPSATDAIARELAIWPHGEPEHDEDSAEAVGLAIYAAHVVYVESVVDLAALEVAAFDAPCASWGVGQPAPAVTA